jgi:hypothetical protein
MLNGLEWLLPYGSEIVAARTRSISLINECLCRVASTGKHIIDGASLATSQISMKKSFKVFDNDEDKPVTI